MCERGNIFFCMEGVVLTTLCVLQLGVQAMNMEWLKSVILYTLGEEGCKCKCKCNNWAWRFEL